MVSSRIPRAVLGCIAAAALLLPTVSAYAAPNDPPPSTEVPFNPVEGEVMSYVVNTKKVGPQQLRQAEQAVTKAGGTVVQPWLEIGVLVVHSTKADFLGRLRADGGGVIESVGPTRTVPVKEGLPGDRPTARSGTEREGTQRTKRDTVEDATAVPPPMPKPTRTTPPPSTPGSGAKPADPMEGQQWDMRLIKADKAHTITDGSRKVLVGVLDDGIDPEHPDLKANIDVASSVNCATSGVVDRSPRAWAPGIGASHGTHVAGTIAAARNGVGIVGVAPNVRLAAVKLINSDGFIYPEYAVCGFMWAARRGMDVTNNSYFIDPFFYWCDDQPNQRPAKEAVRRAVRHSIRHDVVHAAAAGNEATDLANKTTDDQSPNDSTPVPRRINNQCHDMPAEIEGVVSVAATDDKGTKALFSNYGLGKVVVTAPGVRILSTTPVNDPQSPNYGLKSGTSMASPHVAGVLALLKSTHPQATPAQLIRMLERQADDIACPVSYPPTDRYPKPQTCTGPAQDNAFSGEGMVDALDAVSRRPT